MSEYTYDDYQTILNGMRDFLRKFATALETFRNWYQRNADTIETYLLTFAEISSWFIAVRKLADNQIVFTGNLSSELVHEISRSDNVGDIIEKYYFDNNSQQINEMIVRCQNAEQISAYSQLFSEIVDAFKMEHYHLACIGMFSLFDGVLADVSEMKKSTNYKARIHAIEDKLTNKLELNDMDRKILCIYMAINSFNESIFSNSDFLGDEPETLNRHWVIHGRTRKSYTRYDFLKILLWLDAAIFLENTINTKEGSDKDELL